MRKTFKKVKIDEIMTILCPNWFLNLHRKKKLAEGH